MSRALVLFAICVVGATLPARSQALSKCPSSGTELAGVVSDLAACVETTTESEAAEVCLFCYSPELENYMANCSSKTLKDLATGLGTTLSSSDCNAMPNKCSGSTKSSLAENAATICAMKIHAIGSSLNCSNKVQDTIDIDALHELSTGESDVDCGGPFCDLCSHGRKCRRDSDCNIKETCENSMCFGITDYVESTTVFNWITIPLLSITLVGMIAKIRFHVSREEHEKTTARRTHDEDTGPRRSSNTTKENTSMPTTRGTKETKGTVKTGHVKKAPSAKKAKYSPPEDKSKAAGASAEVPQTYSSLERVLEDRTARAQFFAFCKSKFAAENLLFWDALLRYEDLWKNPTASPEAREQEARLIVETFVSHDGSSEVNLAHTLRIGLMQLYHESRRQPEGANPIFQADTFHEAKMEIFRLMNTNFFGEFLDHILKKKRGPPMAAAAAGPLGGTRGARHVPQKGSGRQPSGKAGDAEDHSTVEVEDAAPKSSGASDRPVDSSAGGNAAEDDVDMDDLEIRLSVS